MPLSLTEHPTGGVRFPLKVVPGSSRDRIVGLLGDALKIAVSKPPADGAANKVIAWKLGLSEHTVKFHVASILAKLGAATRTEVAPRPFLF